MDYKSCFQIYRGSDLPREVVVSQTLFHLCLERQAVLEVSYDGILARRDNDAVFREGEAEWIFEGTVGWSYGRSMGDNESLSSTPDRSQVKVYSTRSNAKAYDASMQLIKCVSVCWQVFSVFLLSL